MRNEGTNVGESKGRMTTLQPEAGLPAPRQQPLSISFTFFQISSVQLSASEFNLRRSFYSSFSHHILPFIFAICSVLFNLALPCLKKKPSSQISAQSGTSFNQAHPTRVRQIANKLNPATSNPPNTGVPDAQHAHAPSPAHADTNYGPSAPASAIQARTCAATN